MQVKVKKKICERLQSSQNRLLELINTINAEDLEIQVQEKDQGWKIIDVLRHLVDAEKGLTHLIMNILEGGEGSPKDFDLTTYNKTKIQKIDLGINEIRERLISQRAKLLDIIETMNPEDWNIIGRHPSGNQMSLEKFFKLIYWHVNSHLDEISKKINH